MNVVFSGLERFKLEASESLLDNRCGLWTMNFHTQVANAFQPTLSVLAKQRRFGTLDVNLQNIDHGTRTHLQKSRHVQSFYVGHFAWLGRTHLRRPLFPVSKGAADQHEVA